MALETLKNINEIAGAQIFQVEVGGAMNRANADGCHIHVYHEDNSIKFHIQQGPIKEVGVNGCQVDSLIDIAVNIIRGLNKKYPCRENSVAITKLEEALMWLEARTKDRTVRGVEGLNKE